MASIYDQRDVRFGWNGDFMLSHDGDLDSNTDDALISLLDQIHLVCASSLGDWAIYPNRGADLDDFVGEPNTRTTGSKIADRVRVSLISAGLVNDKDLQVRVFPVHIHKVLIIIKVDVIPTPYNNLSNGEKLQTAIAFDTVEQEIFFLDKTPSLISGS